MADEVDEFDPTRFAVNGQSPAPVFVPKPRTWGRAERFARIPLAWARVAAALPGKALALGIVLWFESGCRRSLTVPLNLSRMELSRQSAIRALSALAKAGLVTVKHRDGRPSLVTLCRADENMVAK